MNLTSAFNQTDLIGQKKIDIKITKSNFKRILNRLSMLMRPIECCLNVPLIGKRYYQRSMWLCGLTVKF
ncbi:hypothetical protein BpHYR1_050911 [Brachionus plicatilis]|uniref:Uncharacterized protein n=1 Tax=Brachionus plicatilis TaxID=10195 RepID=A0A3M7RK00_BRAPC|nr:hypothetical protein BpHYR1_050911 [Brachionus plicatilis]